MTLDDFVVLTRLLVSAAALWVGSGAASLADAPLPPPQDLEVRSPDGRCVARAEVSASRIVASRLLGGRKIALGELYPDFTVIKRTASHWLWYQSTGWKGGSWTVETVDGRTVTFDAHPNQ